ncbi:type I polyketide synthase [Streptomyces sp. NPDC054784]
MVDSAGAPDVTDTDAGAAQHGRRGGSPAGWGQVPVDHPLLGAAVEVAGGDGLLLTGSLSTEAQPWLADHVVHGVPLLSGACFLELALLAGAHVGCRTLDELVLEAPLPLGDHGAVRVQVAVGEPDDAGRRTVRVYAATDDGSGEKPLWRRHADGVLSETEDEAETEAEAEDEAEDEVDAEVGTEAQAETEAEVEAEPPPRPKKPPTPLGADAWPPAGAEHVPLDGHYARLDARGNGRGPAFRGLRALWRRGDETYAEVAVPGDGPHDARFQLHPALWDAALHATDQPGADRDGRARLSFSWQGVRLHADGRPGGAGSGAVTALRVRLAPSGDGGLGLLAADEAGTPVASVAAVRTRPVRAEVLHTAADPVAEVAYQVDWLPLASPGAGGVLEQVVAHEAGRDRWAVLEEERSGLSGAVRSIGLSVDAFPDVGALDAAVRAGASAPGTVLVPCPPTKEPLTEAVRATAGYVLGVVQDWLAAEALAGTRLVVVTQGGVSTAPDDAYGGDAAAAAVWGLVRSVNGEHPGRTVLLDVDAGLGTSPRPTEDGHALGVQLVAALTSGEQQLALRRGVLRVPRLTPGAGTGPWPPPDPDDGPPVRLDPEGVALVTGGTGMMGGVLARHLVREYGVRHLLLASLDGPEAADRAELEEQLTALGASVAFAACDLADRDAAARLLDGLDRPLTAVVHAAGVLDDGPVEELDADRLDAVLRPKVDAAVHLDELTRDPDPALFVVCASVAGVFGGPGQANYGAANAALEALAVRRRALGRPAVSVAWGVWSPRRGMAARLSDAHWARVLRAGVLPVTDRQGAAVFDAALAGARADVVGARLDLPGMRRRYRPVPAFFREVVRPAPGAAPAAGARTGSGPGARTGSAAGARTGPGAGVAAAAARLRTAPGEERVPLLLDLVRHWTADALGAEGPAGIAADGDLLAAGLDSLGAVELRTVLGESTGLRLPATLVLDHPVPTDLAERVAGLMPPPPPPASRPARAPHRPRGAAGRPAEPRPHGAGAAGPGADSGLRSTLRGLRRWWAG